MLSVQFIRENVDRVKGDLLRRNSSAPIDRILELDDDRRRLLQEVEALRAQRNAVTKEIGASKDKDERERKIAAMREVGDPRLDLHQSRIRSLQRRED